MAKVFLAGSLIAVSLVGVGIAGGVGHHPAPTGAPSVAAATEQLVPTAAGISAPVYTTLDNVAELTFDDGPDPVWTPRLLAKLKQYQLHAIFFLVGQRAEKYPALVRDIAAAGHTIGNHSWDHPDLSRLSLPAAAEQIDHTNSVIEGITGTKPTLFRPPYGLLTAPELDLLGPRGMRTVMWNDSPSDYDKPGPQAIASRTLGSAKDGQGLVILLHDGDPGGSTDHAGTVAALDILVPTLLAGGYTVDTVLPPPDPLAAPAELVTPTGESGHVQPTK
jgi:peptidoglycan-N-acetylglucosamine deacetylase